MLFLVRTINFIASTIILCLLFYSIKSYGVSSPGRNQWNTSSPNGYITSLYQGVLGRTPENHEVVNAWAFNINSKHLTRLQIFWYFANSEDCQKTRWGKQGREYSIYYKYANANRNPVKYYVTKNSSDYHHIGPYTLEVAMALRKYHKLKRKNTSSNSGINLLNVSIK